MTPNINTSSTVCSQLDHPSIHDFTPTCSSIHPSNGERAAETHASTQFRCNPLPLVVIIHFEEWLEASEFEVGGQKAWDWFLKRPHPPTPNQPGILARLFLSKGLWQSTCWPHRSSRHHPLNHRPWSHPSTASAMTPMMKKIRKKNLSEETQARVVGMYEAGSSGNQITSN